MMLKVWLNIANWVLPKMKTFCYLRVSTEQQELKSQKLGIEKYLKERSINKAEWITDTISGSTLWRQRALKSVIETAKQGDLLIVSELSRIGRSTVDVLQFMQEAAKAGLSIHAVKNSITLDGSIQSTIFATVMGLAAEIERDFIRSRTKEGMERAKAQGVIIGRPKGSTGTKKLDKFGDELKRLHAAGVKQNAIARLLGVSRGTVSRHFNRFKLGD